MTLISAPSPLRPAAARPARVALPAAASTATAVVLAVALVLSLLALPAAPAQADTVVQRAAGPDRIATAVEASGFRQQASSALLATAFSFPDALAAGALAHRMDAPILLTQRDALPRVVADELARLGVQTVWILGGEAVVSAAIEQDLRDRGYTVRRLAGDSRYETARSIAAAAGPSTTGEVVLALGEHDDPARAWPDAVAAGALAATPDRVPTLLTRPTSLPAETVEALRTLRARRVIIAVGAGEISRGVEQELVDLGYEVERVTGDGHYDVSAVLAADALSRFGEGDRPVVFASGRAFPDALSASSLAASLGAPLMLVPPNDVLPDRSEGFLRDNTSALKSGVIVGGTAAADDYIEAQIHAALTGEPAPPAPSSDSAPSTTSDGESAPEPQADEQSDTFEGQASWYGPGFDGKQTANGETFDEDAMTAAHRTLPFNTVLRVTNLNNGRVVEVRINDRGPFADDRVLDLSSGAADVLDMKHDGVIPVRAEVLSYGS